MGVVMMNGTFHLQAENVVPQFFAAGLAVSFQLGDPIKVLWL